MWIWFYLGGVDREYFYINFRVVEGRRGKILEVEIEEVVE